MQGGDSSRTEWVEFREKYQESWLLCTETTTIFEDEVY